MIRTCNWEHKIVPPGVETKLVKIITYFVMELLAA